MIKQLAGSLRQYRKNTVLTPIFVTVEVIMEVVIPLLMSRLIDYGITARNMNYVVGMGCALLVCAVLSLAAGVIAGHHSAFASAGFAANLRRDMYHRVQDFSFSNIDKYSTSSIITRLTTDVTNLQNAFMMIIRMASRSPLMLIFSLAASFSIDTRLSLIFLAMIPVLGFGLWFIISKVHPIFMRVFKTYDRLNNIVQENLRGIRVVKSFVREDYEIKKFAGVSEVIYDDFSKGEKINAFNMPLMQLCTYACMLLISWFGAKAIVASGGNPIGGLSTGELMSLITYTMSILISLMMLSMVFIMITISRASAERVVEVLNEESDLKNPPAPVTAVPDGSIGFENVCFTYSSLADKPVLTGIDLKIGSGETVGILGGTGSSKTSLVQLIPRLYDATAGRVTVGGVDVRDYDIETLRDSVAMVLQKNELFSGTIKENLRWGNPSASDEELVRVCRLAQADGFIQEFPDKYDTYIEQGGTNVSGGQKQRLCIARALLKKPKILILDDSTSAVDTGTEALIRRAFLAELPETTKIIIAQRISSVQDADKIIVLDDGLVSATGTHDTLLETSQIYREVYESQMKGGKVNE
ncbi:ATP-binding cassette, subfamily B [Sporobacter termitidis DSM 10068]|uniref:ATP-binding cassette, subfamily B n=1 Tax=Sporobacter termitidis DSM 10068 TaxID=1123282 RepID=A0A1M5YM46_9FIRM|nr:ABC transporter ATP-binding protein [Sporobacter termitidis]SHI13041.1 ATP-binding cassette, subfamily B [Sporobacter termitidis DSM 10068]